MCFRPADAQAASKKCPKCGVDNGFFDEVCKACGEPLKSSGAPAMPGGAGRPGAPAAPGAPGAPKAPGAPSAPGAPAAPGAPKAPGQE